MSTAVSPTRVVLVTGAAGGLGQGLVAEFAGQGWRVAAACHRPEAERDTGSTWMLPMDVTSRDQVSQAVTSILARWDRIDALVNNAGITADGPLWQIQEADWDRVLAVNLKGAFFCSQAVLRPMGRQRDGHIINLSSFSARAGTRGQAAYAASKAGLIGLTQALAREAGSSNVRVNAVLPGVLPTPMTASLDGEVMAAFVAANALQRINDLGEVARFIVFLAGMQNVSGQVFQLDSRTAPWT